MKGSAILGVSSSLLSRVPHVSHRFFGRVGGTSPFPWAALNTGFRLGDLDARVAENLARVRFQVGVGPRALFTSQQVHGEEIIHVDDMTQEEASSKQADALITSTRDRAVGVRTADCAPILCAVDDGSAVAAIHAGWRGAVSMLIPSTIRQLCERASVPASRVVACVGPCIGMDAFEVGPEVVAAVRGCDASLPSSLVRAGNGDRHHVDLAAVCAHRLRQCGVVEVETLRQCTATDADAYFSHRRDAGKTGRQISVIALTEPPVIDADMFG
jgi:polyphenol oxidase